jgi:hypothetical protein
MAYPFVQAHHDYGRRRGPVRAFVVHIAEGGGTVGFLSRKNKHGVSVHYVIERSGRIVQMLEESRASGSIRPSAIRTDDDPGGVFGASAAKAVMRSWWQDPNSAVITVEVEGFAKVGPNDKQTKALADLIADVRSRHAGIGVLGHRDFQRYKRCPGRRVAWDEIGGHGRGGGHIPDPPPDGVQHDATPAPDAAPKEVSVKAFRVPERPMLAQVKLGAWLHQRSNLSPHAANIQLTERTPEELLLPYVGAISKRVRIVAYEQVGPQDTDSSSLAMFIDAADIEGFVPRTL